jgi:hypothetical protein
VLPPHSGNPENRIVVRIAFGEHVPSSASSKAARPLAVAMANLAMLVPEQGVHGGRCRLHGLREKERNGKRGAARGVTSSGRIEVLLDGGEVVAVKPENLVAVVAASAAGGTSGVQIPVASEISSAAAAVPAATAEGGHRFVPLLGNAAPDRPAQPNGGIDTALGGAFNSRGEGNGRDEVPVATAVAG